MLEEVNEELVRKSFLVGACEGLYMKLDYDRREKMRQQMESALQLNVSDQDQYALALKEKSLAKVIEETDQEIQDLINEKHPNRGQQKRDNSILDPRAYMEGVDKGRTLELVKKLES